MGNFSRDPDDFAALSAGLDYVGVRLQQAVPLIDADLNLVDDLRRHELEEFGRLFIGNGVPTGDDGYLIGLNGGDGDFSISAGICLVDGKWARSGKPVTYMTQPNRERQKLPLLTPPADGEPLTRLVVLDVWDREVDSNEDASLVDPRIGVEASVRVKREWAVIVCEDPLKGPGEPGHRYLPIARSHWEVGNPKIVKIEDLRDTSLSVLRKVYQRAGNTIVDNAVLEGTLKNTRDALQTFAQYVCTGFNLPSSTLAAVEVLGLQSAQHVAATVEAGLAQLATKTMSNEGALAYLRQVYDAEANFLKTWQTYILAPGPALQKYASYGPSATLLDALLNGPGPNGIIPLKQALDERNLIAANRALAAVASWISRAGLKVARGSVVLSYFGLLNAVLTAGQTFKLGFEVQSFTSQGDTFTVHVGESTWAMTVTDENGTPYPNNKITVNAAPATTTFYIAVKVGAGTTTLNVGISADSNPEEVRTAASPITLTQGQPVPKGELRVKLQPKEGLNLGPFDAGAVATMVDPGSEAQAAMRVFNATGETCAFRVNVSIASSTPVGSWTLQPPATPETQGVGQSAMLATFGVTPQAGAESVQILYRVTAMLASGALSKDYILTIKT
jgi:hypothetical protein